MISEYYTTEFTVMRMSWSADSAGLEEAGTFSGHLQQARPELTQQLGLAMTKTFSIWCDEETDVLEGDSIVAGEITYTVRAIQNNGFVGKNQHLELIVEKMDE